MKADIHPKYVECKVTCGCGNSFVTRSTEAHLGVEICSNCHPFYTGQQRFVDTAGRVEKFQKKYAWSAKEAVTRGEEEQKKALAKAKAQKKRPVRKPPAIKVVAPEAAKAGPGAERGPGGGPGRGPGGGPGRGPGGGPGGRPGGGGRRRGGPGRKGEAVVSSERQRVGKPREEPPAPEPPKAETPPQAEAPKPEATPAAAPQPATPPADKPQGEQP